MNNLKQSANMVRDFLKTINEFPNAKWDDCLSTGQMNSKIWLIEELEKLDLELGTVFLLAGWYGTLAKFMFNSNIKFDYIRSFDLDDSCHEIAETLNREVVTDGWKFKATTFDIFDITIPLEYKTLRRDLTICQMKDYPDTIINTSCEHINRKWYDNMPAKKLFILQSNDFTEIPDHINCVEDIEHMKQIFPMEKILFEGSLRLEGYSRYMLIGYK